MGLRSALMRNASRSRFLCANRVLLLRPTLVCSRAFAFKLYKPSTPSRAQLQEESNQRRQEFEQQIQIQEQAQQNKLDKAEQEAKDMKELQKARDETDFFFRQGDYALALEAAKTSVRLALSLFGEKHVVYASACNNQGLMHKNLGEYDSAIELYEKSLASYQTAYGANHPSVAMTLHNLALVYRAQKKNEKSLELLERSLLIRKTNLGDKFDCDPNVATTLSNLGNLYRDFNNFTRAEQLHRQAITILEKQIGPVHINTATAYNNLGYTYKFFRHYTEAYTYYKKALRIRRASLGSKHPELLASLHNMAELLLCLQLKEHSDLIRLRILQAINPELMTAEQHAQVKAARPLEDYEIEPKEVTDALATVQKQEQQQLSAESIHEQERVEKERTRNDNNGKENW
eukprot:TRINITY_DN12164_c0_g1_i1.p1 TRINITY_DN12164_c0_g1~~TRINITY_DN12164_c0_g1_i1.p1  ORF type:complete len:403 (+),score=83.84 TRINITY_DN12164_c0_g1_i1:59-1267(+)